MNPVARFESFVERLMERTLTRAPHSRLQPVEIAKRLGRVMDSDQVVSALGVRVPNIFDVELSASDFAHFKPIQSSVTAELESYLAKTARDHLYVLASSPIVRLHTNSDLRVGEFAVRAQMEDLGPVANGRLERDEPVPQHTRAMNIPSSVAVAPRRRLAQLVAPDQSFPLDGNPVTVGRSLRTPSRLTTGACPGATPSWNSQPVSGPFVTLAVPTAVPSTAAWLGRPSFMMAIAYPWAGSKLSSRSDPAP